MNTEDQARCAILAGKMTQAGLAIAEASNPRAVRDALLDAARILEDAGMPDAATDMRTLEQVSEDSYLFSIKDSLTGMLAQQANAALDAAKG